MKLSELIDVAVEVRMTEAEKKAMFESMPKVGKLPSVNELNEGLDQDWLEFVEV